MKLLTKFNLILGAVFALSLAIAALVSYQFLKNDARDEVVTQARLMMEAMRAARNYTTNQVKPLLVTQQEHQRSFLPQTVPAFAATERFQLLARSLFRLRLQRSRAQPHQSSRPRSRLGSRHHQQLSQPRANRRNSWASATRLPAARSYLARPIAANPPCLECHSTTARGARRHDPALRCEQRFRVAAQ